MDAVRNKNGNKSYAASFNHLEVMNPGRAVSRFYIRLKAKDMPGVLSKISGAFGENDISLSQVVQKNSVNGIAEIIMVTYEVAYHNLKLALDEIKNYPQVEEISNVIRVEGED